MSNPNNSVYCNSTTFMDVLLEASKTLESLRDDETTSKEDVCDAMERRISTMMGKMASHPTCASFKVFEAPLA